jgi:hypothetical protein
MYLNTQSARIDKLCLSACLSVCFVIMFNMNILFFNTSYNEYLLYVQDIMQELEKERERRWKAEAAAKRLVEHIQSLTNKGLIVS